MNDLHQDHEDSVGIVFRNYLRVIAHRKWMILTVFAAVLSATTLYCFIAAPVFRATTRLIIERDDPNVLSIKKVMEINSAGIDYYQTQYKIIESRAVAREVIKRLKLYDHDEFALKKQDDADEPALVSRFIKKIEIKPIKNSRLVDISFESAKPALAAEIANAVAAVYIDKNLEIKLVAARNAVTWLQLQGEEERKKVEQTEMALLEFKRTHSIITDFSSDVEKITAQELAQLNSDVIEARAKRVEAETRYKQALPLTRSTGLMDSIPEVIGNDLIRRIKQMELELQKKLSGYSKKYGVNHPKMKAISGELSTLRKKKALEIRRIVNSLKNEYQRSLAKEESLRAALEEHKKKNLDLNEKAIQYKALKRESENAKHMYDMLIKRFKETAMTQDMETGNIRVIDRAEIPKRPVRPKKTLSILLAAFIGLFAGVGTAFFFEFLNNSITNPDDVKNHLKTPYLGPVMIIQPETKKSFPYENASKLISHLSIKSAAGEAYRGIRTNILFSLAGAPPKTILVNSANPGEGKTLTTANLGIAMAQGGAKVVAVDCDLRKPFLHKSFNMENKSGVSNILVGSATVDESIIKAQDRDRPDIITAGALPPNPADILGSSNMDSFLNTLKKRYDHIVIDSPPSSSLSDALIISQKCDGVIVVVKYGKTPKNAVKQTLQSFENIGANILGAVLNGIDISKGYGYYYYQSYHSYYYEDGEKPKKAEA